MAIFTLAAAGGLGKKSREVRSQRVRTGRNERRRWFSQDFSLPGRARQHSHGGVCEHVLYAEGLKIVKALDAVQIGMVDLGELAVHMNEGEGWAGNVVFVGCAETGNDPLG